MVSTSRRSSRLPASPGRRSSAASPPSTPTRSTSTSPPRSTTRRSSATLTATSTADVARYTHEELMACVIAREVRDGETVAVGTLAAIPACGVLLAHLTHAPRATVIIINHPDYWPFPGGAGAAMLYYMPRRVVVFRADHSPRVFVERVDTVTSPGATPPDVVRPGGPWKVVTPLCVFRYDRSSASLVVESLHPGVTRDELARRTAFALAYHPDVGVTPEPTNEELEVLRTRVKDAVAPSYPRFAATAFA